MVKFSFLVLWTLISSLRFPLRQREPLHGTKNPILQIGIPGAELKDQLLHLFPLGGLVHWAAIFNHRQLLPHSEVVHRLLVNVQHGPDLGDPGSVQIRHRLEAADPPFIQKRHQKGLHRVIVVMAQCQLVQPPVQKRLI